MIEALRRKISYEEFDYQTLMDCLQDYARPRDKISALLKKGVIIRVKKGLYIFGEAYRRQPYSRELLANLMYGPSYISLEYALHYYGLIPERSEAMTSVTSGRSRKFITPVGSFIYRGIPVKAFPMGMDRIELEDGRAFLIANPEKALADKVRADWGSGIKSGRELREYLVGFLRVDPAALSSMRTELLERIAGGYRSRKVALLAELVRRERRRKVRENHA